MAVISKTQRNAFNSCSTTLKVSMTSATQTTGIILNALIRNKNVVAWPATAGGVLRFYSAGYEEHIGYGSATLDADNNITLVDVTRDLPWNNGASFTGAGAGRAWPAGVKVDLVLDARHMQKIAFVDLANTFTDHQTMADAKKIFFGGGTNCWVWSDDTGTNLKFKDASNSELSLSDLAAGAGTDEKVKVSSDDTTQAYLLDKAIGGDGISATETNGGGNETLVLAVDLAADPGLEFSSNALRVKTQSDGGIKRTASGLTGGVPVGSMIAWLTNTAPTDWLLCYGQAVSRATYADLFAVISTTFGVGDGSTTFNLPDMRGRFPLGQDDMGGSAANRVTSVNADAIGGSDGVEEIDIEHTHTVGTQAASPNNPGGITSPPGDSATSGMSANTDPNIMNPYLTVNYIIRV